MRLIPIVLSVFILAVSSTDSVDLALTNLLWTKEYLQDLTGSRNMGSSRLIEPGRAGVVFFGNSRLLAYEVAFNKRELSSRKGPHVASAFHLHLFLIDASTGTSVLAQDWGTRPRESSVQVTKDKILLRTGTALRLLSSGLFEERQLALPHPDPSEGWETRISPEGETLILNHYMRANRQNFSERELLDGKTLDIKNRRTTVPSVVGETFASSNTAIAINENQRRTVSHNPLDF